MRMLIMLLLPVMLFAMPDKDLLDDYISRGNVAGIIQLYQKENSEGKDYIAMKVMKDREQMAVGQFHLFMQFMRNNASDMVIALKYADEAEMDERVYPFMLEFYQMMYPDQVKSFAMKYQDSDIDYRKYSVIYYKNGVLPALTKASGKGTRMRFHFSARMYSITDSTVYLDMLCEYPGDSIALLADEGMFSSEQVENIIKRKTTDKGRLIDTAVKLAVYFPQRDYTDALSGTEYEDAYRNMKEGLLKNNEISDSVNGFIDLASALYNGEEETYSKMRSSMKTQDPLLNYLDCLYYLFNSDYDNFKQMLSIILLREKSDNARMRLVEMLVLSEYSEDGTLFRMLFLGDYESARPILMLTARNTVLEYWYLSKTGGNTDELKQTLLKDRNSAMHVCIIDYVLGKTDKSFAKEFMKQYPDSPMNIYVRSIL